ncbi:MAG: HU family DNA-binding protein [Magnetococcus sp. DMHC-1]|nr:HU family DNA-binding protein [Magnetococcales bacterium]
MDRSELIEKVAQDTGLSLDQASSAVRSAIRNIQRTLEAGQDVLIEGFGIFSTVDRQARVVRIHHTGEEIQVPACRVVMFTPERTNSVQQAGASGDRWNICMTQDDRRFQAASIDLLSQEAEYTDAIIDLSADMIVSVDAQRKVKVFNKAAQKVYNYTPLEMADMSIAALYGNPEEFEKVGEMMRTQGRFVGEIMGRKKNGELFPARVMALLLRDKNGQVMGAVGYSRDLTEEKAASLAREELAVLKATEEMRKDVDHITRHDLKSPINGIIGFADLLLQDGSLSAEQKESIKIISDLGYRAINMVNLSLGMLKMEKGTYQLTPEPVELFSLIRTILSDIDSQIKTRQIELRLQAGMRPAEAQDTCMAEGEELLSYSMFANLLKNAVEASPRKHPITITVASEAMATVAIHNFGVVPEAIRARFFDKYVTAGKATGTGLGTYSAMLIAKTQKGEIRMQTSEAEGTTVTVLLPQGKMV